MPDNVINERKHAKEYDTLKYSLLGPSLTKSGQDSVDQQQVSEIIYDASKGSKYFNHEKVRDENLTQKINRILAKKEQLEKLDLASDERKADDYIAELELARDLSQTLVHIDCDAFYAAVEELDRPELKAIPFCVGKGVLTTCNYHARKFGCRSGMAGFIAKKLCPELVQISPNFDKYRAKAEEVRKVIIKYDPRFESTSIDEAYLNITDYCQRLDIDPETAVDELRREIHERTSITVSGGIAANAKLAKICSNINKPNGQFTLPRDRNSIMAFIRDLPMRKVNGVGRVFERELDAIGIKTCGDIYDHRQYLLKLFGEKPFAFLLQSYLGVGRTKVQPGEEYERKSIGTESTFGEMENPAELRKMLRTTAEDLERDMRRTQYKGRTLCLKVKLHTFEVFTRQATPPKAVYLADDLFMYSVSMLAKLEQELPGMKLRLMGLRCSHLVSMKKPDTLAFFRLTTSSINNIYPSSDSNSEANRKARTYDQGGWELWPEILFKDVERRERENDIEELEVLSQKVEKVTRHDETISVNQYNVSKLTETHWECPVCSKVQPASEREFNQHIDNCLSRQTIREAIQECSESSCQDQAPCQKKNKPNYERSKEIGRDPKQRRLFFG